VRLIVDRPERLMHLDECAVRACGRVLARTHAMSDENGKVDHDVEPAISSAMGAVDLFVQDVVDFAADAVKRVRRDHKTFQAEQPWGRSARPTSSTAEPFNAHQKTRVNLRWGTFPPCWHASRSTEQCLNRN
jgi:hypothetical protein